MMMVVRTDRAQRAWKILAHKKSQSIASVKREYNLFYKVNSESEFSFVLTATDEIDYDCNV